MELKKREGHFNDCTPAPPIVGCRQRGWRQIDPDRTPAIRYWRVYGDQLDAIRAASSDRPLDLAFVTERFRADREQGITIDVAYRYFSTVHRKFIIAGAPGHEQYTRNMATAASQCDVALLLLDARRGMLSQPRCHIYICWLKGIRRMIAAVNKMDTVEYSADRFFEVRSQLQKDANSLDGVVLTVLPLIALKGENVVGSPGRMPWYSGPNLLHCLETVEPLAIQGAPGFRFPVQYVIRAEEFRFAGRILAGRVGGGDTVLVLPSNVQTRVPRIVSYGGDILEANAGQSITFELEDELDIGRGDMICNPAGRGAVSRRFSAAYLVWMSETPLQVCRPYLVKQTPRQVCAEFGSIEGRIRLETLRLETAGGLALNEIGIADFEVHRPLVFDPYTLCRGNGSFVLIDLMTNRTTGAGMMLDDSRVQETPPARLASSSRGLTIWLTGLSCAGKTTLAKAVFERLRTANVRAELLDGDVIRTHLSKGLGFARADRDENIRRIGFVADLLTRNGVIAIVAAISPYRAARETVRHEIGRFVEVFVNAPLDTCEQRDTKGLYKLARSGALPGFTGLDDPYEPPLNPEVECRTDRESVAESVEKILSAIRPLLAVSAGTALENSKAARLQGSFTPAV